jgi:citronellol/citronellal dehydrogenase
VSTFTDRTLVVSGGSRGIGLAIALGAARHGANVVLLAKKAEPHPKLPGTVYTAVADIEAAGGKGVATVGDVRKEEDVQRAVDTAIEHFGGLDIVGIGFACLWPETYIATAAVTNSPNFETMLAASRSPEIMADAAVEILSRSPADVNGKCFIDSEVLAEARVTDLSRYGGGDNPILDIFVDKP